MHRCEKSKSPAILFPRKKLINNKIFRKTFFTNTGNTVTHYFINILLMHIIPGIEKELVIRIKTIASTQKLCYSENVTKINQTINYN